MRATDTIRFIPSRHVPEDATKTRSSPSCRCTSAATQSVPRPPILLSFHKSGTRAVSFCRDELCRRVPRRWCASLLYHSHYACLRQRRYRSVVSMVPHVPFPPSGKERRCQFANHAVFFSVAKRIDRKNAVRIFARPSQVVFRDVRKMDVFRWRVFRYFPNRRVSL